MVFQPSVLIPFLSKTQLIDNGISLSGVQFGLKSTRDYQIARPRSGELQFVITSLISDQNCTTRSAITTLLYSFGNLKTELLCS